MVWDKAKIVGKIYDASETFGELNRQQFSQIRFALDMMDENDAFDALYSVLAHPSRYDGDVDHEYAGRLLYAVQPGCPIAAIDAIRALTATYSLSVEQVPYYFASCFGKEVVLEILNDIKSGAKTPEHKRCVETWAYWIRNRDSFEEFESDEV